MELNREQIKKALECCSDDNSCYKGGCPYESDEVNACTTKMSRDALALIKELTEEVEQRIEDYQESQRKWEKAYDKLEYTLEGVMHSVDKWLEGSELELDEVNRAIMMREKTLKIVENLIEQNEQLTSAVNFTADVTRVDTVRKMQERINQSIDNSINVFDFQISECNAIRQALRGVKNHINQIAKELMEGTADG